MSTKEIHDHFIKTHGHESPYSTVKNGLLNLGEEGSGGLWTVRAS